MKKIFFILLISFILTGCYDYQELDNLTITTAVGINYKDDMYELTLQVIDTTNEEEHNFYVYKENGRTIQEAFRKAIQKTSKKIYGNHIEILLISDKINDIRPVLDFFFRDTDTRSEFDVVLVNDIDKIINYKADLKSINSEFVVDLLENQSKKAGIIKRTSFKNVLESYINKNKEIVLPYLKFNDDQLTANNMAILKDGKFSYEFDEEECKAYNFLLNKINNVIISNIFDNNYYSIEIMSSKTNYKFKNKILYINIYNSAYLKEINSNVNLSDNQIINQLERNAEDYLKKLIYETMLKSRKYNSEPFNIRDYIFKNDYEYYKNNNLDNLNIKINVDINITNKGQGVKTIAKN